LVCHWRSLLLRTVGLIPTQGLIQFAIFPAPNFFKDG
jgi:hypothetical protein